jgi:hypothetical protein
MDEAADTGATMNRFNKLAGFSTVSVAAENTITVGAESVTIGTQTEARLKGLPKLTPAEQAKVDAAKGDDAYYAALGKVFAARARKKSEASLYDRVLEARALTPHRARKRLATVPRR